MGDGTVIVGENKPNLSNLRGIEVWVRGGLLQLQEKTDEADPVMKSALDELNFNNASSYR